MPRTLKDTVMVRTTVGQRWRVIGMHQAGMRAVNISRALAIPRSTVSDIIRRRRLNPDDVKDAHRSCVGLCTTLGRQCHRRAYVASWRVFDDGSSRSSVLVEVQLVTEWIDNGIGLIISFCFNGCVLRSL